MQNFGLGAGLFANQWRMSRMQVVNWGTFCGYHDFPLACNTASGDPAVVMITGESGTGKSTLLDAKTAVLMPYNVRFNAASNRTTKGRARGEAERNVYSYLLGQQDDVMDEQTGESRHSFLRDRAQTNWSALVLTFEGVTGGTFAAARFYYVPANATRSEYTTRFVTAECDIDPRLAEPLVPDGLTDQQLRSTYEGATTYKGPIEFLNVVYRHLDIGSGENGRNAMKLHEQIQAGYSVEDVDGLFKSLVLDEPSTYEYAQAACNVFDEKESTWKHMQEAQSKFNDLRDIRTVHESYSQRHQEARLLSTLNAGEERGALSLWLARREAQVCGWSLEEEQDIYSGLEARVTELEERSNAESDELARLTQLYNEQGGGAIDVVRADIAQAKRDVERRRQLAQRAKGLLQAAGREMPADEAAYVALRDELEAYRQNEDALREDITQSRIDLALRSQEVAQEVKELSHQIEHYQKQDGLMPERLTNTRDRVAKLLGVSSRDLPFAGELMDLPLEHEQWRVAANVGYHGLARTLLVDERLLKRLSVQINGLTIGFRLNFLGIDLDRPRTVPTPDAHMLSSKLVFREDSPFVGWLREHVSKPDVDYVCVEDPEDLDGSEAQITREGQTRKGRRGAHGHARDSMVIGFKNDRLLSALRQQRDDMVDRLAQFQTEEVQIRERESLHQATTTVAEWVYDHPFADVDVRGAREEVDRLVQQLRNLESNEELRELERQKDAQQELVKRLLIDRGSCEGKLDESKKRIDVLERRIDMLIRDALTMERAGVVIGSAQEERLDAFAQESEGNHMGDTWTQLADSYTQVRKAMETDIARELRTARMMETQYKNGLETTFANYRKSWLGEESDLGTDVESYPDYLEILEQLEADELTGQVADTWLHDLFRQVGGSLVTLSNAYRDDLSSTRQRIEQVNDIMGGFKFGPEGGHLRIDRRELVPADLNAFRSELQHWTTYAMAESSEPIADAEHRGLRTFMERLHADLAGKKHPLLNTQRIVRMSVTVTWPDDTGRSPTVFTTLSAKSGGETQELVAFILGAALLYCLGNNAEGKPAFSPVFLDEAFIKADDRFTRRAVNALTGLGFQVIIAVPTNKVQEVEPVATQYACVTKRRTDGHSFVVPMTRA